MEALENTICCGCLCPNRKLTLLVEYWKKQCFLHILDEIPISQVENIPIWLCWECNAQIKRFTNFKHQVKMSYSMLTQYDKQNAKELPNWASRLTINSTTNINIPTINNVKLQENIKEETIEEPEIQEVSIPRDYDTTFGPSDDEIVLKKVNKIKVRKKKRKKIEKDDTELYKEVILSKSEIEDERSKNRMKDDFVNAMFKCENCVVSFPNGDDLKDHITIKHNKDLQYTCDICTCSFNTEVSYKYHTGRHARRYECSQCSERLVSKRSVRRHIRQYHGPTLEYSLLPGAEEGVDKDINVDEVDATEDDSTKQPTQTFPCELCNKTFRWKTSLRKHVETHRIETGQKRKPYCEPCRLSFTTTSNLQKHVKTSSKHQIQLKLMKLKAEDPTEPEKHLASIAEIKSSVNSAREQFPCAQCDRRFQWRGNLLRHLHSHVARAKGELVCQPCNRTFSSIATYKQHMKISKKHVSEDEFKYMCSDCGKRFANKTRLKDHVDWEHLKNYVHTCNVCQKVFKSHTSLYLHKQVVHKKDLAEHLCDHCGRPFPNHAKLRSHMTAAHSGAAAYCCGTCGARFNWHSCLSRHARKVHAEGQREKSTVAQ